MKNLLFIHCPWYNNDIKLITYWVFWLCDSLLNSWVNSRIIHLWLEENDFNLVDYIIENKIDYVCFSIQWFLQMKQSLDISKNLKDIFGDKVKIILWWFTATYYKEEIEKLLIADKIIEWEWSQIFDYVWINNSWEWSWNLLNFSLLKNYQKYLKINYFNEKDNRNIFYLNYWKWCTNSCPYCSWNSNNFLKKLKQKRIYPNSKAFLDNLISWIKKYDLKIWYISFHDETNEDFYIECFKELNKNWIKIEVIFELFFIPSNNFLEQFNKYISKDSLLILSPDSWSEKVRKLAKIKFYFTNKQLLAFLEKAKLMWIKVHLSFSVWLFNEEFDDFKMTIKLIIFLKSRYIISSSVSYIEIEPWSLLHENNLVKSRYITFEDFLNKKWWVIWYDTSYFVESEIIGLFNIANASVMCNKKIPNFYQKLIESSSVFLKDIPNKCSICENYNNCFKLQK